MGNIVLMFICKGGSVSVECDNLENMDWVINEMEKRGFIMWPGLIPGSDDIEDNSRELADHQDYLKSDFCPVTGHGFSKKWQDTKDGGYYCGHKTTEGKWCGYKEDEDGRMVKPPKTMPNYVKF